MHTQQSTQSYSLVVVNPCYIARSTKGRRCLRAYSSNATPIPCSSKTPETADIDAPATCHTPPAKRDTAHSCSHLHGGGASSVVPKLETSMSPSWPRLVSQQPVTSGGHGAILTTPTRFMETSVGGQSSPRLISHRSVTSGGHDAIHTMAFLARDREGPWVVTRLHCDLRVHCKTLKSNMGFPLQWRFVGGFEAPIAKR